MLQVIRERGGDDEMASSTMDENGTSSSSLSMEILQVKVISIIETLASCGRSLPVMRPIQSVGANLFFGPTLPRVLTNN